MKPGWKSTEFWLSLVAVAIGALLSSGAITNQPVLQALGVVSGALAAMGYSAARGITKSGEAKASAAAAVTAATLKSDAGK